MATNLSVPAATEEWRAGAESQKTEQLLASAKVGKRRLWRACRSYAEENPAHYIDYQESGRCGTGRFRISSIF